jgi:hypothetical protein
VRFAIAGDLGLDLNKGIAAIAERVGQDRDRMFDPLGVVPIVGLDG